VHGWILGKLLEIPGLVKKEQMAEVYQPLSRWTRWWFDYRDYDQNGLPKYNHGNDSGLDNSTVFAEATPVESPDLYAFLVIQLETLGKLARQLGRLEEAVNWQRHANQLLGRLLAEFWQGDHFVARRAFNRTPIASQSLLLSVPIVLGKRLPASVRQALVEGLPAYLTEYGLASESPQSSLFDPQNYWRGAIWGATTFIITEGLAAIGETELAHEINLRFCKMAARSGMSENYHSLTGQDLCDPAFSWTASIFLILLQSL
jgi:glycogen debranching enzyme